MVRLISLINTALLIVLLLRQWHLHKRLERKLMGLKEDVATLAGKIGNIEENSARLGTAAQAIADDTAALKKEITELNERSNVDLSGLIQRAENISSGVGNIADQLQSIAGPVAGSDPGDSAPPPATGGTGTEPGQ